MWPNVMEASPPCSQEPLLIKQDLKLSFKVHLTIHEVKVETIQPDIKPLFCVFRVQGSERNVGSEGGKGVKRGERGKRREGRSRDEGREEGGECMGGKEENGCVFYDISCHLACEYK